MLYKYKPGDDQTDSGLELRTLHGLRALGLPEPVKQHRVLASGHQRRLDFAYPELKIGIEAHSRAFHARLTDFDNDIERDADLRELGWKIYYVTSRRFDTCLRRVRRALAAASFVNLDG